MFASVAQLVEQRTENPRVDGSIPSGSTNYADLAHPVERHLAKVKVASSSLVIRSRYFKRRQMPPFKIVQHCLNFPYGVLYRLADKVSFIFTLQNRSIGHILPAAF